MIRKGRENYLCLLNFQEAVMRTGLRPKRRRPGPAGALGDGQPRRRHDRRRSAGLAARPSGPQPHHPASADRRGECIYSACEHYRNCFVERNIRRARHADIVIANHALVMIQAAMGGARRRRRGRCATCSTRAITCSMPPTARSPRICERREAADLRRWLLGSEGGRMRGLKRRVEDLVAGDAPASEALQGILEAARALPEVPAPAHRRGSARGSDGALPGGGARFGARPGPRRATARMGWRPIAPHPRRDC